MPYSLDDKLVLGISSRALFDLTEANAVYESEGIERYREYQRERESVVLEPGTGFPLVRALLAINARMPPSQRLVEVIVISRNDADSAMRVFNSIDAHHLDITRGAFTNGGDSWRYLQAFRCSLFLSVVPADVIAALRDGFPAALLLSPPQGISPQLGPGPVRVAFDGDAVLFSDEAQRVFDAGKLPAFYEYESALADQPLPPGPLRPFLDALGRVQAHFGAEDPPIRTALVTARDAPAHRRVITTLRSWQVRIDETFFLGGVSKADVLAVLRPHIFFDDQLSHLEAAAASVPSGHVLATQQLELLPADALPEPAPKPKRPSRRKAAAKTEERAAAARSRPPETSPSDRMARSRRAFAEGEATPSVVPEPPGQMAPAPRAAPGSRSRRRTEG